MSENLLDTSSSRCNWSARNVQNSIRNPCTKCNWEEQNKLLTFFLGWKSAWNTIETCHLPCENRMCSEDIRISVRFTLNTRHSYFLHLTPLCFSYAVGEVTFLDLGIRYCPTVKNFPENFPESLSKFKWAAKNSIIHRSVQWRRPNPARRYNHSSRHKKGSRRR